MPAPQLDHLHATAQRIVPGSLLWLPHPTRAGRLVAGVMVEPVERKERER